MWLKACRVTIGILTRITAFDTHYHYLDLPVGSIVERVCPRQARDQSTRLGIIVFEPFPPDWVTI